MNLWDIPDAVDYKITADGHEMGVVYRGKFHNVADALQSMVTTITGTEQSYLVQGVFEDDGAGAPLPMGNYRITVKPENGPSFEAIMSQFAIFNS